MEFYSLAYYTEQVKARDTAALEYAIREINEILPNFEAMPEFHAAYIHKLYNELDACRTELGIRARKAAKRIMRN